MRARDSTRCAISAAPLMASSIAVIPAPVTGTGSKVPSGEACKSSGLAGLVCATIPVVLGVIVRTKSRGYRNVVRRSRMPRFLNSPHAPLDPALVLFAQFGFTDLKDLARPDSEFANLLCHHRRHVHHPIAFERVHNLFAIASFDAFSVVPAEGYFDWGVCIKSQNSIRHCCSPCSPCCSSSGGSNPSSGGSGKSSGGSSSSSCSSSSSLNPDWHSSMLACARSRTIAAHGVSSEAASGECTPSFCFSCSSSADLRSCHSSSVDGSGCDLSAVRLAGAAKWLELRTYRPAALRRSDPPRA